jgi:ribosomal protein S18 acetylase RimI-like enzyme
MGNRGRFGKYGETKRLDRLRQAGKGISFQPVARTESFKTGFYLKKRSSQKGRIGTRPARASDLKFVIRLSGRVFDIYGPYRSIISQWIESGMAIIIVAFEDKKPVGFAMIGPFSNESHRQQRAELLAIAVQPEKQHRGIGQRLIEEVEAKAAELKLKKVILHTATDNLPARKLFLRNGYASWGIEKTFYPAGQDALVMSKDINF